MQFHKISTSLLLIFITCCIESALSSRLHHQKGRSAATTYRIFPLYRRKPHIHGRSSTSGIGDVAALDSLPVASDPTNGEGRVLMKKLLLFKSLFQQQKSAPSNNIIIITQPSTTSPTTTSPTTTTTPSTTGTSTTTAAASPTGTTSGRGTQNKGEIDEVFVKAPLIDDKLKKMENMKPEELAQQLLKENNIKKIMKNRNRNKNRHRNKKNPNKKLNQQEIAKNRQRKRRRQRKRNKARKQLQQQQQQQQKQLQHQPNNIENVISNFNSANKKPTQDPSNSSNDISSNNNATGILNLNTNMRLQNIMNAFRKQTPIMYNY